LRESSTLLFGLLMLAVTSAGAVSVTTEREQDTWTSLRATLVTETEIVRGKLIGAAWGARRLFLALGAIWTVGLLAGAIHPLGVLAATVALGVFAWFASALGLFLSIKARNSTRALVAAVAVLLILNGGYLALFAGLRDGPSWVLRAGVVPFVEWASLLSYRDVAAFREPSPRGILADGLYRNVIDPGLRDRYLGGLGRHTLDAAAMYLVSIGLYSVFALALTRAALRAFRKADDRA
jgi:hypothetical protein